jgi:hypothetical protein
MAKLLSSKFQTVFIKNSDQIIFNGVKRKLVAVGSGEMDEEALEKLKREQKKKQKDKIKKEKKKEIIPEIVLSKL